MAVNFNIRNDAAVAIAPTYGEFEKKKVQLERTAKKLGVNVDIFQIPENEKVYIQVTKTGKRQGLLGLIIPKKVQRGEGSISLEKLGDMKKFQQKIATIAAVATEKLFRATKRL